LRLLQENTVACDGNASDCESMREARTQNKLRQAYSEVDLTETGVLGEAGDAEWLDFVALNPKVVFEIELWRTLEVELAIATATAVPVGDSLRMHAEQLLRERRHTFALTNRSSLDLVFFRDRNGKEPSLDRPPYTARKKYALYNKLQWVSPCSLLLVWRYLGARLHGYKTWLLASEQARLQQQSDSLPSPPLSSTSNDTYSASTSTSTSTPNSTGSSVLSAKQSGNNGMCTRAALLIDPRYSELLYPVSMNVLFNLGPECWTLHIHCRWVGVGERVGWRWCY